MEIIKALIEKSKGFVKNVRKERFNRIFKRIAIISPDDLVVENYPRKKPLAAFNPAAVLLKEKLYIFPRLVFDYYTYNSSIGMLSVDVEKIMTGELKNPIPTQIVLWPDRAWEFGHGCEDARICYANGKYYMLYTGSIHMGRLINKDLDLTLTEPLDKDSVKAEILIKKSLQAFAIWKDAGFEKLGYLRIINGDEEYTPDCKDSAFLSSDGNLVNFLFRPTIKGISGCWKGILNLENLSMDLKTIEPSLGPEDWEIKVGWSTNAVELKDGNFLVGWHAVLKEDFSYVDGLALMDAKGNILGITDYILYPTDLAEIYGDRNNVIFGDGLVLYEDHLLWIGGISDYAMGIFIADLNKVMENMRTL